MRATFGKSRTRSVVGPIKRTSARDSGAAWGKCAAEDKDADDDDEMTEDGGKTESMVIGFTSTSTPSIASICSASSAA